MRLSQLKFVMLFVLIMDVCSPPPPRAYNVTTNHLQTAQEWLHARLEIHSKEKRV